MHPICVSATCVTQLADAVTTGRDNFSWSNRKYFKLERAAWLAQSSKEGFLYPRKAWEGHL